MALSKLIQKVLGQIKDGLRLRRVICRLAIHGYVFVFKAGVHDYYECKHCKNRTLRHNNMGVGYSPIDWKWLNGT